MARGSAGGITILSVVALAIAALAIGVGGPSPVAVQSDTVLMGPDFDGDGFGDLAVGVPGEDIGDRLDAGVLNVLYGSADGLVARHLTLFHQDSRGVHGVAEHGDAFGAVVAPGDLDGDGYDDLAVGVPGEGIGPRDGAGVVIVLFGSSQGLTADGAVMLYQGRNGLHGVAEDGDGFGLTLAIGDVTDDDTADLVVGVPLEDLGAHLDAGAVHVVPGSGGGPRPAESYLIHQDSRGLAGVPEDGDLFGSALAIGDVAGDGSDELVVGAPGEGIGTTDGAGAVHVLRSASAPGTGDVLLHQDAEGVGGDAEPGDHFGAALAIGDLDADGYDDLAVAAAGEDLGSADDAGAVHVFGGRSAGPAGNDERVFWQGIDGIPDGPADDEWFGAAMAVDDVTGNGIADLIVGVPGEATHGASNAGAVMVIPGSDGSLATDAATVHHQGDGESADDAETGDLFGSALGVVDSNGDGIGDVAVGVPGETIGSIGGAGTVHVLHGSDKGLRGPGLVIGQPTPGVSGQAEPLDRFGAGLWGAVPDLGMPVGIPFRRDVTFDVAHRGDVQSNMAEFASLARSTYEDRRGWVRTGTRFRQVSSGGEFTLWLATPDAMTSFSSSCSPEWSCRVGEDVIVNDERWRKGTSTWTLGLHAYRHYVVIHETGHWLGLGHWSCPSGGRLAPVMMQQSKGAGDCEFNVWPTPPELDAAT